MCMFVYVYVWVCVTKPNKSEINLKRVPFAFFIYSPPQWDLITIIGLDFHLLKFSFLFLLRHSCPVDSVLSSQFLKQ